MAREVNLGVIVTLVRIAESNGELPAHCNAESLMEEAAEYAQSYSCDESTAIRDVIDAYREGEAEAADAMRNGDWDYGRE